jgi:hypothetical protein
MCLRIQFFIQSWVLTINFLKKNRNRYRLIVILDPHHFIAGVVRVAYVVTHVPTHWVPLVVISKIWNPFLTPVLAEPPPPPTRICRAEICQGRKKIDNVAVLRIRNKSFGSCFGSGSGLKLVSDPDPVSDPDSNPDLDQKLAKFFFILKFLRSLIFKAALHQLCDLATNKVRKKLAIYEDLSYCLCIVSLPHAVEHKVHI